MLTLRVFDGSWWTNRESARVLVAIIPWRNHLTEPGTPLCCHACPLLRAPDVENPLVAWTSRDRALIFLLASCTTTEKWLTRSGRSCRLSACASRGITEGEGHTSDPTTPHFTKWTWAGRHYYRNPLFRRTVWQFFNISRNRHVHD